MDANSNKNKIKHNSNYDWDRNQGLYDLKFKSKLSYNQISRKVGLTPQAVYVQVKRHKEKLDSVKGGVK